MRFDEMTGEDLFRFFIGMGVSEEDMDLLIRSEVAPLIEALERASPSLRSTGLKTFDDLLGREMEELVEKLRLTVQVQPRDYFPADGT
jgi:serine/threonine-protein kinase HipA